MPTGERRSDICDAARRVVNRSGGVCSRADAARDDAAERQRVLLAVKENEAANPSDISLLGEMAIVSGAQLGANTIHETRTFHVAFAFPQYLEYTNAEPRRCEASACPHAGIYDGYGAL